MSHQSGITLDQELCEQFGKANRENNVRYIIATIEDEKVKLVKSVAASGSDWEADLDKVPSELEESTPAYVLYNKGDGWILMAYVPDKAKVKGKMLYASTRATVKRTLGANFFVEEMFGTLANEFSKDGYAAFKSHQEADAPLTRAEFERQEELEAGEIYQGGAGAYVHGVAFPAAAGVNDALKKVCGSGDNYVVLGVDTENETITLQSSKANATIDTVRDGVSLSEPQFHFFRYSPTEVIFIFTCPDGSGSTTACPIKKRMLYSSSKARVVQLLEQNGGSVAKTFEFNEPADVDKDDIENALHPPKVEAQTAIRRPAKPGRGARKLIRSNK